jgi:diguanylate cyclase (GGDEF)-like protein
MSPLEPTGASVTVSICRVVAGRASWVAACVALGLLWCAPAPAAEATNRAEQIDRAVLLGEDWYEDSGTMLDALPPPGNPQEQRALALARAQIAAQSGAGGATGAPVAASDTALTESDRLLIAALRAERGGDAAAEDLARRALSAYEAACSARTESRPDCEYRPRWHAQLVLLRAAALHRSATLPQLAEATQDLARAGNDGWRMVVTDYELALAAFRGKDLRGAGRHVEQVRRVALAGNDPALRVRALIIGAVLLDRQGDTAAARQTVQQGLALARQARLPRLEARALVNLSDIAAKSGRAAEALQATQQALPIARRHDDWRLERVLLHNAALARVALGRASEAARDFEQLQSALARTGDTGFQVASMREYGDALAAAGDLKGALDMHRRERELASQLSDANRDKALAELRTRFDREAQQRRIGLLARDNALASAALENQALTQRLWALGLCALALAAVLMVLLLRRVRQTNQLLKHSQAHLRVQSERDALTGLANRRHFQSVVGGETGARFSGALLMIDIDHFKHINDGHGHAAGDSVLVEVARRIAESLRAHDLVARWGGEEFLAWAPGLGRAELDTLAQRLLTAVAGQPVTLPDGRALRVTVSIGHAAFPLPPHRVPLTLDQAINLADMALYTAKSQGRNRAVGIAAAAAASVPALGEMEADFERACSEGRVQLRVDSGPQDAASIEAATGTLADLRHTGHRIHDETPA